VQHNIRINIIAFGVSLTKGRKHNDENNGYLEDFYKDISNLLYFLYFRYLIEEKFAFVCGKIYIYTYLSDIHLINK